MLTDMIPEQDALLAAAACDTCAQQIWHKRYLGKQSHIAILSKNIKQQPDAVKKIYGQQLQQLRQALEELYTSKFNEAAVTNCREYDFSALPIKHRGSRHPLSIMENSIKSIMQELGFKYHHGPHIESSYYNFDALNTLADHPARSVKDTFYLDQDKQWLLRTHTTAVQARALEQLGKQLQRSQGIVTTPEPKSVHAGWTYGSTYRRDDDATHTPCFTQVDAWLVGENVTVTDLQQCLTTVVKRLLPNCQQVRFRPSFFPFTFISYEIDIMLDNQWLEVSGSGMIHPQVLERANLGHLIGFAFAFGIERMTMLRYDIRDIRHLYKNDIGLLSMINT